MKKIVFVCLGNICRSPSGEGVFKYLLKKRQLEDNYFVDSAGTSAYHVGEKADSRMRKHALKRGYNLTSRSRQFIKDDLNNFDLIIPMDSSNFDDILHLAEDKHLKKVKLMTDFSSKYKGQDVPDPYYGGDSGFELVLDILEESCNGLLDYLENEE